MPQQPGQPGRSAGAPLARSGGGARWRRWRGHARIASSRNRDDTTRSAKVAMMIEPITTTTPAAEARPYSWAW